MKKITLLFLVSLVATGCNGDPLVDIKSGKVSESSSLTWEEVADKFSYCKDDTRQWAIVDEDREDRKKATFTCALNDKSVVPYNEKLEQLAKQDFMQENQRTQNRIRDYAKRRDDFRNQFKETYQVQCQGCSILDAVTDSEIDTLALAYFQDKNAQEPIIKALQEKLVMLDGAFWSLGETLSKLSEVKEATPSHFNAVSNMSYTVTIIHWLDEKRKKYQGDFDSSEEIILTFSNGETKHHSNLIGANYIIENQDPTGIVPKSYSTSSIFNN